MINPEKFGPESVNNDVPVTSEDENVVPFNPEDADDLAEEINAEESAEGASSDDEGDALDEMRRAA